MNKKKKEHTRCVDKRAFSYIVQDEWLVPKQHILRFKMHINYDKTLLTILSLTKANKRGIPWQKQLLVGITIKTVSFDAQGNVTYLKK